MSNHYTWLEKNLPTFFKNVGLNWEYCKGIIGAHGDKCYGYMRKFQNAGIPFEKGVAIYLLSYCKPFSSESRQTKDGWVPVEDWVVKNYSRFEKFFPNED